ncbi:MAG: SAM-dependent methyltransferase [Gammaproteobacteria bacterium]|nr:MAG: SAM-dependent methyltransferase [Gammaproteobacteria bacterium]RLA62182.1 MAG: SAM-dependent methyltransferase [Gammaproteobacteria bacterium]
MLIPEYLPLLQRYLKQLELAANLGPVLDLACGSGRGGLRLIANKLPVIFADISAAALLQVELSLAQELYSKNASLATLWPVDLEQPGVSPLDGRMFGAIVAYHYLYRPLLTSIKQAVYPGGMVIYETFTVDQPQYGRPKNPDFLLRHGELHDYFCDWIILHSFEGVVKKSCGEGSKAIAQLVAKKPSSPIR